MTTVVAAHGLGLGPWLYDAWAPRFEAAGFRFRALRLPGHGDGADASLADVVRALEAAVDEAPGRVVLLAHSFSALAAQLLLTRAPSAERPLAAAILMCPLPPGRPVPPAAALRHLPRAAATLALGRPYLPSRRGWKELGFSHVPDAEFERVVALGVPWPPRLCRDLLAAPAVAPASTAVPVLVALGGADPIIPPERGRVVADLFEGVAWKYDGVGHAPMLEPGGARMLEDILAFAREPVRPQVLESEGFGPAEGAGHQARKERRGARTRKRSAYGQKGARS